MARIYKGSKSNLQLLLTKCQCTLIEDVKIAFYTSDYSKQVTTTEGITINGNIANVSISSDLFDELDGGVISYVVYGTRDGISFIEERQSNYYLKADIIESGSGGNGGSTGDNNTGNNKPEDDNTNGGGNQEEIIPCKHQEKVIEYAKDNDINDEGFIIVTPDAGYDAMTKVSINRNIMTAPPEMFALYDFIGTELETLSAVLCARISMDYLSQNNYSLEGVFDYFQYAKEYIMTEIYEKEEYGKCLFFSIGSDSLVSISRMYTGSQIVPALYCRLNGTSIKTCEDAFKGWELLSFLQIINLGKAFENPQTLDLSMTRINNPNIKLFASQLYDFGSGANDYGVYTSYIKGINQEYRHYFTSKGWECID